MASIKVGCDPEVFFQDSSGNIVPAHLLIPGSKEEPFEVRDGAIQVDGLAGEFNIIPATTKEEFSSRVSSVMGSLLEIAKTKNQDVVFSHNNCAEFSEEFWMGLPGFVKVLGCDPDYDAYRLKANRVNSTGFFRTCGGHIHIGWGEWMDAWGDENIERCVNIVKKLDETLYPELKKFGDDSKRESLYGAKGAFRPKHYGVEYRSPSNLWLFHNEGPDLCYTKAVEAVQGVL